MLNRSDRKSQLLKILCLGLAGALLLSCTSGTGSDTTPAASTVSPDSIPVETVAESSLPSNTSTPLDSGAPSTEAGATTVVQSSDQLAIGEPFVLQGNGVDDAKFGDDLGVIRETFVAKHGEPDDDSGWSAQQGPCDGLGTKVRTLTWGNLVLEFSNGPTEFGPVNSEHFISYYSDDEQETKGVVGPDGLTMLDQTVASLRKRFPGATFAMNEIAGPEYVLPNGIAGSLSGLTETDTSQTFRAGLICID